MRIDDRIAPQKAGLSARPATRTQGAGFHVPTDPALVNDMGRSVTPSGTGQVSALFQLQVDTHAPQEIRKRAVRRGTKLLDRLDRLKAAFLIGEDQSTDWQALAADFNTPRDPNLPPEVANLLDEIDVRVAVELAKRGL